MTDKEKVYGVLDSLGIKYKVLDHEEVHTIEEMDALGIFTDGEVCKNLFLRNANGKIHYIVSILKDKLTGVEHDMPKMQIFTHSRAFFVLTYDSMPAPKKSPIARKYLYFGCFAV